MFSGLLSHSAAPAADFSRLQRASITFRDVAKRYGDHQVLNAINLQVEPGEVVAILGPSGSGKSTLIRLINQLESLSGGEILIDGKPTSRLSGSALRQLRSRVGFVFQQFNLYAHLTAQENITLALERVHGWEKSAAQARALALLRQVGLEEKAQQMPAQLSGGQQQRVAIARALATDPKVLLCDEATSALDPTTTNSILALLKELNQKLGVTVVIITHQMSAIEEICTRVAILDGGEVAEEGRVEDIFAHPATDAARRLVYPGGVSAKQYPAGTRAVRVSFNGGTVYDPLIASLAIDCGVKVTILGADTRTIDGKAFGTMLLLLPDDPNEAAKALSYIRAKALSYIRSQPNITAEEVEYHA